jgi:sirohydrochlorin cobaltochelatase
MTKPTERKGVVLLAHGSRDPLWHQPIAAVAAQVATLSPQTPVVCAYLELSTPNLTTAVDLLRHHGVQSVSILPVFLGVGKHAREDLPRLVEDERTRHPDMQFVLQNAVGEDPRVVQLLAQIALGGH